MGLNRPQKPLLGVPAQGGCGWAKGHLVASPRIKHFFFFCRTWMALLPRNSVDYPYPQGTLASTREQKGTEGTARTELAVSSHTVIPMARRGQYPDCDPLWAQSLTGADRGFSLVLGAPNQSCWKDQAPAMVGRLVDWGLDT